MMTLIILLLLLGVVIVGVSNKKEFDSYSIANKSITFPLLFSSLVATYLGPGFTLGFIGEATTFGLFTILFFSAYGLQTILTGLFIYPKFQSLENIYSLGGFLKSKFGVFVQFISGVISLALMIVFSTIMVAKGGGILGDIIGGTAIQGVLVFTCIVALYSISGGLKASIVSDAGQLLVFGGVFIALFILIIGLKPDFNNSLDSALSLTTTELSSRSILSMIALFVSCAFGEALVPPYISRALSADSVKTVKKAFVIGGVGFIIWSFMMAFIGLFCMDLSSIIPLESDTDNTLQLFIQEKFSSFWFNALMIALILVFMSTFDSLLNSGSVIFTSDIVKPIYERLNLQVPNQHNISKVGILIFCVFCVFFSLLIGNVIQALLYGYSIWAPSMIPIILYSVLSKNTFKVAAILSMVTGIFASAILKYLGFELEFVTLYGLGLSSGVLVLVHVLSSKKII